MLLIFALLNLIWLWCIRKQIAFTATVLKSVAAILTRTPELLLVQLLMAGAVLGVMALWGGAYIELLARMDEYDADHKSDAGAVGYWAAGNLWALVSLFWVQVRAPHLPHACMSPPSPSISLHLPSISLDLPPPLALACISLHLPSISLHPPPSPYISPPSPSISPPSPSISPPSPSTSPISWVQFTLLNISLVTTCATVGAWCKLQQHIVSIVKQVSDRRAPLASQ